MSEGIKMVKNIVEAGKDIANTFQMLDRCIWGITHTVEGDTVLICRT